MATKAGNYYPSKIWEDEIAAFLGSEPLSDRHLLNVYRECQYGDNEYKTYDKMMIVVEYLNAARLEKWDDIWLTTWRDIFADSAKGMI